MVKYSTWMKRAGWRAESDDASSGVFYMDLTDRRLISFAQFVKLPEEFVYDDGGSVGNFSFRKAYEYIAKDKNPFAWITQKTNSSFTSKGSGSQKFINECTSELISWANSLDLTAELSKRCIVPSNGLGPDSFGHVIALALLGKTETLNSYLKSAKAGEYPVIAPLVKVPHLERAIEIARRNEANG